MVKTLILIVSLLSFSCSFFLTTPFPDELTRLQSALDVSDIIREDFSNSYIRLVPFDDYLLINTNGNMLHIFRADDLSYVKSQAGSYQQLYMPDTRGGYIFGNQHFDAEMANPTTNNIPPVEKFGIVYNNKNFTFSFDKDPNELRIDSYDSNWGGESNHIVSGGLENVGGLSLVVLDDSAEDAETDYVILLFYLNNDESDFEWIRLPFSYINPPSTLSSQSYPFGLQINYLPDPEHIIPSDIDHDSVYYTRNGMILISESTLWLAPTSQAPVMLADRMETHDIAYAFTYNEGFFYKFDTHTKWLSKVMVWW